MKATIFLIILSLVTCQVCVSQTFDEWFKQQKMQKKYLLLQIARLQVYLGYVKQGYQIVKGGLRLVGDIQQRDFNLHNDYFRHLKTVTPTIRKYSKVAAIIAVQVQMLQTYQSARSTLQVEAMLTKGNLEECQQTMGTLLDDVLLDVTALQTVLTDGSLSMTDAERVEQIDQIYISINHKKDVLNNFLLTVNGTIRQRQQSSRDMDTFLHLLKP
jgi:hypothetical protein